MKKLIINSMNGRPNIADVNPITGNYKNEKLLNDEEVIKYEKEIKELYSRLKNKIIPYSIILEA